MTTPPHHPDDEPRSEPFRPMSYDLAPQFGTPPPEYPVSGQPGHQAPGYQAGQPGHQAASAQSGYPPAQTGYPPAQTGYPPARAGYPAAAQPGYPAATGQTGYPAAFPAAQASGYPGPAQPPFPPPPPAKKGNGLKITLVVLGVLFLVCAAGGGYLVYRVSADRAAAADTHVTAPSSLPGDLTQDTSDTSKTLAGSAESSLRKDVTGVGEVASGVYTESGDPQHAVVLVAATGSFSSPGREVDDAFKGFEASGDTTVTSAKTYDAGRLGGTVKCADGSASSSGTDAGFAMCVWGDRGSIGLVLFFGRKADDAAPLFIQIREAVETRS